MLELHVEWQEAPGVQTDHLAATWARLEVRVDGRAVTQFWSHRSGSVRPAVYSSVFPLARWVVRNWWHLLHEGLRAPSLVGGARGPVPSAHLPWLHRHNSFLAREGMAYPDLCLYRQGDEIALRWVPDPEGRSAAGRFVDEGFALVPREAVVDAFTQLVELVMERLDGVQGREAQELAKDWAAIREADADEAELCRRLAALGVDPYDPDGDEAFEDAVARIAMPRGMLRDLLDASPPERLADNASLVETLAGGLPTAAANGQPILEAAVDPRPYATGYARARRLRESLQQPADGVPELDRIVRAVGADEPEWREVTDPTLTIDGVVQLTGRPALSATTRSERAKRFLLARALHHWHFLPPATSNRRLLSRSNDWEQAASRAFAAELLAPAAALAERLGDAGWEPEEELAEAFGVAPMVIAHQLENHRLA